MKTWMWALIAGIVGLQGAFAQARVALIKMPYVGERNVPELSGGPDYLYLFTQAKSVGEKI